jgi:hypothetical protein
LSRAGEAAMCEAQGAGFATIGSVAYPLAAKSSDDAGLAAAMAGEFCLNRVSGIESRGAHSGLLLR